MPEIHKNTPDKRQKRVLYGHEIVSREESLCKELKYYCKNKIVEVLLRGKEKSSYGETIKIIGADKMLQIASGKIDGIQKNDIEIFKLFLTQYPLLSKKFENTIFQLNISPITLLDETYWNQFLVILGDNSYNRELYHKLLIEITEVEDSFGIDDINRLNCKIKILKENFGINSGIDDYPSMSNNYFMLKNIKGINFVKLDKSIVLPFCNGSKTEKAYQELKAKMKIYTHAIKSFHPNVKIILEGIEDKDICVFINNNFPEISHFQGHLFGKPSLLK